MPEKENKELNPQEIAEQRRIAQEKAVKPVADVPTTTAVVQGPSEAEQAITKAYDNNIKNTELLIKGWEGKRANAVQQDEVAQRKSRNMQMIAGLSDGLASLANLIGVADRGTNIDMGTGALTPLQQKMEAARLERKADIKSIDDRLEQYRQQLLNMQLAKGSAVASQKATEAERAYKTSERVAGEKHAENMLDKKIIADAATTSAKIQSDAYQNALDRQTQKDVANIRSGNNKGTGSESLRPVTLINEDGTVTELTVTKGQYDAIMDRFDDILKMDGIEAKKVQHTDPATGETYETTEYDTSTPLGKAYSEYLKAVKLNEKNKVDDTYVEGKRNAVINASPTMRKMLTHSASKWSNWAM